MYCNKCKKVYDEVEIIKGCKVCFVNSFNIKIGDIYKYRALSSYFKIYDIKKDLIRCVRCSPDGNSYYPNGEVIKEEPSYESSRYEPIVDFIKKSKGNSYRLTYSKGYEKVS